MLVDHFLRLTEGSPDNQQSKPTIALSHVHDSWLTTLKRVHQRSIGIFTCGDLIFHMSYFLDLIHWKWTWCIFVSTQGNPPKLMVFPTARRGAFLPRD